LHNDLERFLSWRQSISLGRRTTFARSLSLSFRAAGTSLVETQPIGEWLPVFPIDDEQVRQILISMDWLDRAF